MAKVLVAGAGGYIGVPLCKKLIERGHSLIALDRFFFGRERVDRIALSERAAVITEDISGFGPEIFYGGKIVVDPPALRKDAAPPIYPQLTPPNQCAGDMRFA